MESLLDQSLELQAPSVGPQLWGPYMHVIKPVNS